MSGVRLVHVSFLLIHLEASIQLSGPLKIFAFSIVVGEVNDAAEGTGKGAIILDFGGVFLSACFVQVGINEGFHRIQVNDMLGYGMVTI